MKLQSKTSVVILSAVVICIAVFFIYRHYSSSVPSSHVMKNSSKISIKDAISYDGIDFTDPKNVRDFLAEGKVNSATLSYLDYIMNKFQEAGSFEEHYEQVKDYLYSILPADEAEKMLSLYKKYIEYQRGLERDVLKWPNPTDTASAIKYLEKLQDYRRQTLGDELADALFGTDVKVKEYQVRKSSVVSDPDMKGADKEAELAKLNIDMWGDDASQVSQLQSSYDNYQDKLSMYKKDFSEMTDQDQKAKIREFREQLFTPEVVKRLEDVDNTMNEDAAKENSYREKESAVQNDPSLSAEEKEKRIAQLQEQIYGSDADAFRRMEAIRKASK